MRYNFARFGLNFRTFVLTDLGGNTFQFLPCVIETSMFLFIIEITRQSLDLRVVRVRDLRSSGSGVRGLRRLLFRLV